jgi:hypothetical protein
MGKYNLSEAAKQILVSEGSKETFDANVSAKQGQRGSNKPEVGTSKLSTSVVTGQQDAGDIGHSPEKDGDELPDYTKGTPSATPPGATPPVGSEPAKHLDSDKDEQSKGRADLVKPVQAPATDYAAIRDRVAGKRAAQTMQANPGATFQSYGEDIEALMQGEELSEEFKTKASTIYEAAVMARVDAIAEQVEIELTEQFEVAVEQIKEDLAAKVDDYLNYMVEEWMKDNEIAIEKGLRAEIVEDFIGALRNVFVEHYIDIPTDKVDVVEELATKVEELEAALNEEIGRGIELSKELNEQKKIEAIYTACEGLTQTQVEKLKSLAENVEFTTEEEFAGKLSTLKESYFKAEVKVADNSSLDDEVQIEEEKKPAKSGTADALIESYAKTISQSLVK